MRRVMLTCLLCALLAPCAPAVQAAPPDASPDYRTPGLFALPWACGEGHVITWDPQGHWEANKASGVAYDFRMTTGTPLYAPVDGVARFGFDERPFETNLGHYVDLATLDGAWMIRLAHLQGAQSGERQVRAGELLGHSGASGVEVEHLHLELFVRSGDGWTAPDLQRLTRLFGLARTAFFEGAMLTNDTCASSVTVQGEVLALDSPAVLGRPQRLQVLLRNDGLDTVPLEWLQVSLYSPNGLAQAVSIEGDWQVPPREALAVELSAVPEAAGAWYVGRVTVGSAGRVTGQPASGALSVNTPQMQVAAVSPIKALYDVGALVAIDVLLHNSGRETWRSEGLAIEGVRPGGAHWEARYEGPIELAGGRSQRVRLTGACIPQEVGRWQGERIVTWQEDRRLVLGAPTVSFGVTGAQLALKGVTAAERAGKIVIWAQMLNVGSELARIDRIEAWGWSGEGEDSFVAISPLGPLLPGQMRWLRLEAEHAKGAPWRLADVGYWLAGVYYSAGLPRYIERQGAGADLY